MTTENKTYRIGALLGSLNGAGAEKTILTLCTRFAELGHKVDLVTLTAHADYPLPDNLNQIVLSTSDKKKARPELKRVTLEGNYDFFVTSKPEFYDAIQAKKKVCSVHITPTAWITDPKWKFLKRASKILRLRRRFRNKQLIALSQGIKDDLVNNLGCKAENITVIPNPYQIEEIRSLASQDGPLPDGDYIVYVASLNKRKRQQDLIRAFQMMKRQDLKLVLVGKGNDEQRLRSFCEQNGLQDQVLFWGWDANPYRLIRNASLSMLTSEAEGLPRVLVESLIIGTPVVSTDCPSGPKEVLTGDLQPYLVPVGDVAGLCQAMSRALNQYPELSSLDVSRYAVESVANQYLKLVFSSSTA
ncbi:glycosyltransferase [Thalassolituus hydrocarboniclasticus]|uniref:Glycosyltransferase n=1 Tax=Thalassolituus hydrocarboniclasticus TaxID=2742796 RepID=A0ABY6A5Z4_9GAMM|nr:glycosyltransferase [Thalassolituus hydrocarboniclasticus]UXD86142.1 glycosyltransferase [Thalassolituus hydrocarboniclasticus]